jgi:hypothetical protein
MLIFLIGRQLPGSLTPSTDAAARRVQPCRLSEPGFMGRVRPAAGQKGRGEEASQFGRLFSSPFLTIVTFNTGKFSAFNRCAWNSATFPRRLLARLCYSALA